MLHFTSLWLCEVPLSLHVEEVQQTFFVPLLTGVAYLAASVLHTSTRHRIYNGISNNADRIVASAESALVEKSEQLCGSLSVVVFPKKHKTCVVVLQSLNPDIYDN
jgi:hypothetical protein